MSDVAWRSISLQTPRLLLRPLERGDLAAYSHFHQVNAEHFRAWTPTAVQAMSPEQAFEDLYQRGEEGLVAGTCFRLFAFWGDGRLAGVFVLSEVVRRAFQNAYVGWRVSCEFTRMGVGTEGVTGLLDLAFANIPHGYGLHRVQANIQPENVPSLRLARKLGFREEGLAKRYLDINGEWRDHLMFAKTREEHQPTYTRVN